MNSKVMDFRKFVLVLSSFMFLALVFFVSRTAPLPLFVPAQRTETKFPQRESRDYNCACDRSCGNDVPLMLEVEVQAYFHSPNVSQLVGKLGLLDAELIIFAVVHSLSRETSNSVVIDIGANVGQSAASILAALHPLLVVCKEAVKKMSDVHLRLCRAADSRHIAVHSFEADEDNCAYLAKAASDRGWENLDWHLNCQGVASFTGTTSFYKGTQKGSQLGSLQSYASNNGHGPGELVNLTVTSMDHFVEQLEKSRVYLLKVDTEGSDLDVLEGSRRLLKNRRIKFIVFEYNAIWKNGRSVGQTPGGLARSLESAVSFLNTFGYVCFLISANRLHPLTGPLWHSKFEIWRWSNVFCGHRDDPDVCQTALDVSAAEDAAYLQSLFFYRWYSTAKEATRFDSARE